jgi:hypothetical protein
MSGSEGPTRFSNTHMNGRILEKLRDKPGSMDSSLQLYLMLWYGQFGLPGKIGDATLHLEESLLLVSYEVLGQGTFSVTIPVEDILGYDIPLADMIGSRVYEMHRSKIEAEGIPTNKREEP